MKISDAQNTKMQCARHILGLLPRTFPQVEVVCACMNHECRTPSDTELETKMQQWNCNNWIFLCLKITESFFLQHLQLKENGIQEKTKKMWHRREHSELRPERRTIPSASLGWGGAWAGAGAGTGTGALTASVAPAEEAAAAAATASTTSSRAPRGSSIGKLTLQPPLSSALFRFHFGCFSLRAPRKQAAFYFFFLLYYQKEWEIAYRTSHAVGITHQRLIG